MESSSILGILTLEAFLTTLMLKLLSLNLRRPFLDILEAVIANITTGKQVRSLTKIFSYLKGMGDYNSRGYSISGAGNRTQRVAVGTQEYLELCELLGAEPLISLNLLNETVANNAKWVNVTNVQGLKSRATGI